jgi:hypothetical protein
MVFFSSSALLMCASASSVFLCLLHAKLFPLLASSAYSEPSCNHLHAGTVPAHVVLSLLLLLLQAVIAGHHVGHLLYSRIAAAAGAAAAHAVGAASYSSAGVLVAGSFWSVSAQWQGQLQQQ